MAHCFALALVRSRREMYPGCTGPLVSSTYQVERPPGRRSKRRPRDLISPRGGPTREHHSGRRCTSRPPAVSVKPIRHGAARDMRARFLRARAPTSSVSSRRVVGARSISLSNWASNAAFSSGVRSRLPKVTTKCGAALGDARTLQRRAGRTSCWRWTKRAPPRSRGTPAHPRLALRCSCRVWVRAATAWVWLGHLTISLSDHAAEDEGHQDRDVQP